MANSTSDRTKDKDLKKGSPRRPSRQGKKIVSGFFEPELATAAKTVATLKGISLEGFLEEALREALNRYLAENVTVRTTIKEVIEKGLKAGSAD